MMIESNMYAYVCPAVWQKLFDYLTRAYIWVFRAYIWVFRARIRMGAGCFSVPCTVLFKGLFKGA